MSTFIFSFLGGSLESPLIKPGPNSHQLHPLPIRINSPLTQLSRDFYFLCGNDAHSWASNGLQGWRYGVCQRLDPGQNPGDCIRQSPRIFNSYKMYLFPVWNELLTYSMGEIGPMLRTGMNYKSIGCAPLKHYSDTLNEMKLAKRL